MSHDHEDIVSACERNWSPVALRDLNAQKDAIEHALDSGTRKEYSVRLTTRILPIDNSGQPEKYEEFDPSASRMVNSPTFNTLHDLIEWIEQQALHAIKEDTETVKATIRKRISRLDDMIDLTNTRNAVKRKKQKKI